MLIVEPRAGKKIGLRAARRHVLFNGPLECRLLEFPIAAEAPTERRCAPRAPERAPRRSPIACARTRALKKWAEREDVHCCRVYDADLVEYAVAVDVYENAAHVQEYAPPATIDPARAEERLDDVIALVPEVLGIDATDVTSSSAAASAGASSTAQEDARQRCARCARAATGSSST